MSPDTAAKHAGVPSHATDLPESILFGTSPVMAEVRNRAEKTCGMNVPVLLLGDGGTGKESLARWIHAHSMFKDGQFVKVNCAAIPGTLLESELFGYEKGSFTGANHFKPGRVEQADRGTLFLDEIADLDMSLQSKLLHFLQDGTFARIGDQSERAVNTRVICATSKNLEQEIDAGRFRSDLYYRINVVKFRMPRLRERREDIGQLSEHFRFVYERQFGKQSEPLGAEMIAYLQNLEWPGNVRELSNYVARYVLMGAEAMMQTDGVTRRRSPILLKGGPTSTEGGMQLKRIAKQAIKEMERAVILEALRVNQWNRRKTAETLKISYRALIYKIRDAGLISRRNPIAANDSESRGD